MTEERWLRANRVSLPRRPLQLDHEVVGVAAIAAPAIFDRGAAGEKTAALHVEEGGARRDGEEARFLGRRDIGADALQGAHGRVPGGFECGIKRILDQL